MRPATLFLCLQANDAIPGFDLHRLGGKRAGVFGSHLIAQGWDYLPHIDMFLRPGADRQATASAPA